MFAKYLYLPGATQANVQADVIGLLNGSITTTGQLSASADVAGCVIVNTIASGWSQVDTIAGTPNKYVLTAPNDDGGSTKTMTIQVSSTTITVTAPESWNTTTHVATNDTTAYTPNLGFNLTNGGIIYMYVSPRTIQMVMGHTGLYSYAFGIVEGSRVCKAYELASGLPIHMVLDGNHNGASYGSYAGNRISRAKYIGHSFATNTQCAIIPDLSFSASHAAPPHYSQARTIAGVWKYATDYDKDGVAYYEINSNCRALTAAAGAISTDVNDFTLDTFGTHGYNNAAGKSYRLGRIKDFWVMQDNIGAYGDEFITADGTFVMAGLRRQDRVMFPKR